MERMLNRGKETGRADDNLDTIKKRLDVYHNQTSPLRDYYTKDGIYLMINGSGVVDDIFNDIADKIEKTTGNKRKKK